MENIVFVVAFFFQEVFTPRKKSVSVFCLLFSTGLKENTQKIPVGVFFLRAARPRPSLLSFSQQFVSLLSFVPVFFIF